MGKHGLQVKRRAVFLDRDGVLNLAVVREGKPYPPNDAGSLEVFPDAANSLQAIKERGFLCICVTNQPDVARGRRTLANVTAMNAKVQNSLPLDDLYTCLHDGPDMCDCRKPKPGMLLNAAAKWHIDLEHSYMIGDRAGDMQAGAAAGCANIFIDHGYAEAPPEADLLAFRCVTLHEACDFIIAHAGDYA